MGRMTLPHLEIIQRAESPPLWSTVGKQGRLEAFAPDFYYEVHSILLLFESNVMLEALLLLLLLKYGYWCGISMRIALCIFGLSLIFIFNPTLR